MRITMLVPELGLGGAERSLVRFANQLSRLGSEVSIIVFRKEVGVEALRLLPRVKVHTAACDSTSNPLLWFLVRRWLKVLRPEVVIGWSTYANMVALITQSPAWRTIVVERNYPPQLFDARWTNPVRRFIVLRLMRTAYRSADMVAANSSHSLKFLRRFVGTRPMYGQFRNCIEEVELGSSGDRITELSSWPSPRIVAVGRLAHQKGFDVLLRALARVRKAHDWQVVIVGDGEERERLQRLAAELGVSESVTWMGARRNPIPFYEAAEIVVVPSRYEGFPNVLLEAMALGRATIASDCRTGPAELTQNGKFGALVPVEDVEGLAREIERLGSDPAARAELGEGARAWVRQNYSSDVVSTQILELIMNCVRQRR